MRGCEISGDINVSEQCANLDNTHLMQLAVAEGPNHWPGCLPQAVAPWSTNLWIENGASGLSANSEITLLSSFTRPPCRRQSLPIWSIIRAFASRLWPDLIMQPHPVSVVKPSRSARLRNLTEKLMAAAAVGSCDFAMGGKFERYVIHALDSKSSRKSWGQPPSEGSLDRLGAFLLSTREASSKLPLLAGGAEAMSSGEVDEVASEGACVDSVDDSTSTTSSWSVVETGLGGGPEEYSRPRHHIGMPDMSSFFGGGS